MVKGSISIEKGIIERKGGVVVLDFKKYQILEKEMKEYEEKKKLLRSLERFESLVKWGRGFAKKRKITPKQVLEND